MSPLYDLFIFETFHHARIVFPPALRPSSVIVGTIESLGGGMGDRLMGLRIRNVYWFTLPHSATARVEAATINHIANYSRLTTGVGSDVYGAAWPELRECRSVAEVEALLEKGPE